MPLEWMVKPDNGPKSLSQHFDTYINYGFITYQVFTTVRVQIVMFWVATLYTLGGGFWRSILLSLSGLK
jgi:hypothetical protein